MRKPSFLIPLLTLSIFGLSGILSVQAAWPPRPELSDSLIDDAVYRRPDLGSLLDPDDSTPPEETPPEETPPEGEDPLSPIGFILDGNDYLETRFTGDLGLSINGHQYTAIKSDTHLVFSLETLSPAAQEGETPPPSAAPIYYVGIKTPALGHYQIFFSDFDPAQFRLSLTVKSPYVNETMELNPASLVSFQANDLRLLRYGGTEAPEVGLGPTEETPIANGEVVYIVEMNGDLMVAARANPMFADDPVPVPQPEANPQNNQPNNVNVPTETVNTDTNLPTGPVGAVGAEFGGSGCFSQLQPLPLSGDFLIWMGALSVFLATFWKRR